MSPLEELNEACFDAPILLPGRPIQRCFQQDEFGLGHLGLLSIQLLPWNQHQEALEGKVPTQQKQLDF